jgi:hypothetical protein
MMRNRVSKEAHTSPGLSFFAGGLTLVCVLTVGLTTLLPIRGVSESNTPAPAKSVAGLSGAEVQEFADRFARDLWPTMKDNCLPCHGQKNASQFLLLHDPKPAFVKMLSEGFFDPENHTSVVARITTTDDQIVMPPVSMGKLPQNIKSAFEQFAEEVASRQKASGIKSDEIFPAHLELPYTGAKAASGLDNTFVTFRQLRGKVKQIFGDDWVRGDSQSGADTNKFIENAYLFGGADFIKRFDESAKASPTYFSGIDLLSRDIAGKAYLSHAGPFTGFPVHFPAPGNAPGPSPAYSAAIRQLYNRILYRDPTAPETRDAFAFIQSIYRAENLLSQTAPQDMRFALTVKDETGLAVTREVSVRVSADNHAVRQELVDQSQRPADEKEKKASRTLFDSFIFHPGDSGQKLILTNEGTQGNVSVAGITLRGPLKTDGSPPVEKWIPVDDPSVRPEGAWQIRNNDGFVSYEDNDENKGKSLITFPITVTEPGEYEIALTWRATPPPDKGTSTKGRRRRRTVDAAERVLVEVDSRDKASELAMPTPPPIPEKGVAEFAVDETLDTIPFADLKTAFRFGPGDGVELSNVGTRRRVVGDAVRLLPPLDATHPQSEAEEFKTSLVLKAADAKGYDKWIKFDGGTFGAYNTVGPSLFQDTDEKGKRDNLTLTFEPETARKDGFEPERFYRVGIVYPGRVENETHVPVRVRARASSPIIQVVRPLHANLGATITLDASSTYNVQRSKLSFKWQQIGGPKVLLPDPTKPVISFVAPRLTAEQAAWEGLCRALIGHPDFLFTRPRTLAYTTDRRTRRHLQLVKIAQDLVARTPTPEEIAAIDSGTPLEKMVDRYLGSKEFADFYFHRTRLYVESHGTPEQDEPARLWTYITTHDRPFKEILTADYTVDTNFVRQSRPAYYGKTGVLTMKGFIEGKPGLPHFNYPAQVTEKFLGYVFEVPDAILKMRNGITASATTDPNSVCYTCHKVLTPLSYQRSSWDDNGNYRVHDDTGMLIDDSDQGMVASYPYKGAGIEAFATQAQNKERFIRTILQTHFVWYFGRELRYDTDERELYKRLWVMAQKSNYALRPLIRAIVTSPEYLNGNLPSVPIEENDKVRRAKLALFHRNVVRTASGEHLSSR